MHENIYRAILKAKKEGGRCTLVTVVDKKGSGPSRIGGKMLVFENGMHMGTVGGGSLEWFIIKKAVNIAKQHGFLLEMYSLTEENGNGVVLDDMICGGNVMVFYEYVGSGYPVYVFGTGHVGKHVAKLLSSMNFFVNAVEPRKEFIKGLGRIRIYNKEYRDFFKEPPTLNNAFVFVSTSNHVSDLEVLKYIYSRSERPVYVGLLASRKKGRTLIERLKKELDHIDLSNLYTPCGLDIGGDTPFEIALAVVSEIQGIKNKRNGLLHRRMTWYLS